MHKNDLNQLTMQDTRTMEKNNEKDLTEYEICNVTVVKLDWGEIVLSILSCEAFGIPILKRISSNILNMSCILIQYESTTSCEKKRNKTKNTDIEMDRGKKLCDYSFNALNSFCILSSISFLFLFCFSLSLLIEHHSQMNKWTKITPFVFSLWCTLLSPISGWYEFQIWYARIVAWCVCICVFSLYSPYCLIFFFVYFYTPSFCIQFDSCSRRDCCRINQ